MQTISRRRDKQERKTPTPLLKEGPGRSKRNPEKEKRTAEDRGYRKRGAVFLKKKGKNKNRPVSPLGKQG